jgi:hypothetical protein
MAFSVAEVAGCFLQPPTSSTKNNSHANRFAFMPAD